MKKYFFFLLSIVLFLIDVGGLFFMVLWIRDLLPFMTFDKSVRMNGLSALAKNFSLIALFGIQHTAMARTKFKEWWTQYIPHPIERSIFVLLSGLICVLIVFQWESIEGVLWLFSSGSFIYLDSSSKCNSFAVALEKGRAAKIFHLFLGCKT